MRFGYLFSFFLPSSFFLSLITNIFKKFKNFFVKLIFLVKLIFVQINPLVRPLKIIGNNFLDFYPNIF